MAYMLVVTKFTAFHSRGHISSVNAAGCTCGAYVVEKLTRETDLRRLNRKVNSLRQQSKCSKPMTSR